MRLFHHSFVVFVLFLTGPRFLPAADFVPPHLLPGGVTDGERCRGFLATADGGIDAVRLDTGERLWHTAEAQRPLFVHDGRLYAVAAVQKPRPWCFLGVRLFNPPPGSQGFRIRALDVKDSSRVLESSVVELPDWVSVSEVAGQAFATRWQVEKDALLLNWEARSWYIGSKKATPEIHAAARRCVAGAVRVSFRDGAVAALPATAAPAAPAWPFATDLEKMALRWQGVSGSSYKALVVATADGREKLVLRSWDYQTHADQGARELLQGKALFVLATTDERYLCVREALPSPDHVLSLEERRRFDWSVFSVDTGERVGALPFDPATQAITVLDGRAFLQIGGPLRPPINQPFQQPRSVRAMELTTGKTLWERPIASKPVVPPSSS